MWEPFYAMPSVAPCSLMMDMSQRFGKRQLSVFIHLSSGLCMESLTWPFSGFSRVSLLVMLVVHWTSNLVSD